MYIKMTRTTVVLHCISEAIERIIYRPASRGAQATFVQHRR